MYKFPHLNYVISSDSEKSLSSLIARPTLMGISRYRSK